MQSPMTPQRAHKLNAIYQAMPYNCKSVVDGFKMILVGGTFLIRLIDLDDAEIEQLLPPDYF
jgi:hypothetical protein